MRSPDSASHPYGKTPMNHRILLPALAAAPLLVAVLATTGPGEPVSPSPLGPEGAGRVAAQAPSAASSVAVSNTGGLATFPAFGEPGPGAGPASAPGAHAGGAAGSTDEPRLVRLDEFAFTQRKVFRMYTPERGWHERELEIEAVPIALHASGDAPVLRDRRDPSIQPHLKPTNE